MSAAGSVGGGDRLRLFLALQLPATVVDELVRWQTSHLTGGRPVAAENLHVTLAFLGGRPAGELPGIVEALARSAREAGPLALEPARWRETRSVGMLVLRDVGGAAGALARSLHERLEALGVYRRERRPWLPHLTMLRFRERPRLEPPPPPTGTFVPSGAAAYVSRLHPTGARYEVLDRVLLTAGG